MANVTKLTSHHHSETSQSTKKDTDFVNIITDIVDSRMINPFKPGGTATQLINIATGLTCPSTDIIRAEEIGTLAIQTAASSNAEKIILPKLQTFVNKNVGKFSKNDLTEIYMDETSVTRALCFFQHADTHTRNEAFSHEWTKYPTSLFCHEPNGTYTMRNGTKSDFLSAILSKVGDVQQKSLPVSDLPTACLIDFMAFMQRFQNMGSITFGELSQKYMKQMFHLSPEQCNEIHIVGDRYDWKASECLKESARESRRIGQKYTIEYTPSSTLEIPEWKKMVGNQKNKANFQAYIAESFRDMHKDIPEHLKIVIGGLFKNRTECVELRKSGYTAIDNLSCTQHEEADTRILAHLAYCVKLGIKRAIIIYTDTDIILLCLYHFCFLSLEELWILKNNTYLTVHEISRTLARQYMKSEAEITGTLLSCYVLSGCDTTSYPFRRGKRVAARVALGQVGKLKHLSAFGSTENIDFTDTILSESRLYFVALYGKEGFTSLDVLRQHLFAISNKDRRMLPPTEDAFRLHALRSMYQLLIYHRATQSDLELPPATEFGRKLESGKLVPILTNKPAKPSVAKSVTCKCKTTKCLKNCICARNGIACFIGCTCLGSPSRCGRYATFLDDEDDVS